MTKRIGILPVLLVMAAIAASPAIAQETPKFEIGVNYSILSEQTIDETLPVGWTVPVAYNFNHWLAVAGEVGANYRSDTFLGQGIDINVSTYMAGPKFTKRGKNVTFFFQMLGGAARGAANLDLNLPNFNLPNFNLPNIPNLPNLPSLPNQALDLLDRDFSRSATQFALQPGGGIDVSVSDNVAIRLQGDYRASDSRRHHAQSISTRCGSRLQVGQAPVGLLAPAEGRRRLKGTGRRCPSPLLSRPPIETVDHPAYERVTAQANRPRQLGLSPITGGRLETAAGRAGRELAAGTPCEDLNLDVIMRVYAPDLAKMKTWKAPKAEMLRRTESGRLGRLSAIADE